MERLIASHKLPHRFVDGVLIGMVLFSLIGLAYEFLLH